MRNEKLNLFNIFLFVIAFAQFFIMHSLNSYRVPLYIEALPFDYSIPLIPMFAIVVLSVYALLIFTFIYALWKADNLKFAIFLFAFVLTMSLSNLIYSVFPTMNVIRPEVFDAGFMTPIVNFLYTSIPPYNTFPSSFCVIAILCSFFFFRLKTSFTYIIHIWAGLICVATIFTKMNYLLDFFGSIPLAVSCYLFTEIAYSKFFKTD